MLEKDGVIVIQGRRIMLSSIATYVVNYQKARHNSDHTRHSVYLEMGLTNGDKFSFLVKTNVVPNQQLFAEGHFKNHETIGVLKVLDRLLNRLLNNNDELVQLF